MKSVLIAAAFGLVISILATPVAVHLFRRKGFGQEIRDDGPESHLAKQGTPTMGGTVIVAATVGGYLIAHLFLVNQPNRGVTATGLLLMFLMVGLGTVGFRPRSLAHGSLLSGVPAPFLRAQLQLGLPA